MTPIRRQMMLSIAEVAEQLGVSTDSVYRLVADGHLPSYLLPHSRGMKIRAKDVEALIDRCADPMPPRASASGPRRRRTTG